MSDKEAKGPGGSRSGGDQTQREDTDPMHDPSAAGADLYEAGNKTGNPVSSGTPGIAQRGDAKGAVKQTPTTVEHKK